MGISGRDRWVIRKIKGENKAIKERKRWERESVSKKTKVHIMKWLLIIADIFCMLIIGQALC